MQQLTGAIRHYPWGSRTLLADLRGAESPADRPEAELWFGAHAAASATVDGEDLTEVIARDPVGTLGERVYERYGTGLPFLIKLLGAGEPLSLQAHPSVEQAREGFARENMAKVALSAPERNYKDDNHKPEIVVALTDFQALSGFRPVELTRELFDVLDCTALNHYSAILGTEGETHNEDGENDNLRALFTTWITIPGQTRTALIDTIVESAQPHLDRGDWISDVLRVVIELNERYPGDVGVLGALLLNHVNLAPGEAMHTPAGQLHAYLSGLGVEIMANSDNVLRGGLTSKYVDVPELVRVLRFTTTADPRIEQNDEGYYVAPVEEFELVSHRLAQGEQITIDEDGPAVVLCTAGAVTEAAAGHALWIPASDPAVTLTALQDDSEIFVATV